MRISLTQKNISWYISQRSNLLWLSYARNIIFIKRGEKKYPLIHKQLNAILLLSICIELEIPARWNVGKFANHFRFHSVDKFIRRSELQMWYPYYYFSFVLTLIWFLVACWIDIVFSTNWFRLIDPFNQQNEERKRDITISMILFY